jgi:hypothetical protein
VSGVVCLNLTVGRQSVTMIIIVPSTVQGEQRALQRTSQRPAASPTPTPSRCCGLSNANFAAAPGRMPQYCSPTHEAATHNRYRPAAGRWRRGAPPLSVAPHHNCRQRPLSVGGEAPAASTHAADHARPFCASTRSRSAALRPGGSDEFHPPRTRWRSPRNSPPARRLTGVDPATPPPQRARPTGKSLRPNTR